MAKQKDQLTDKAKKMALMVAYANSYSLLCYVSNIIFLTLMCQTSASLGTYLFIKNIGLSYSSFYDPTSH